MTEGPLANRQKLVDRKRQENRARLEADEALRTVATTLPGQNVLWRLITSVTGAFSSSFDVDSRQHAFNEGKRSVGLALVRELQRVAPNAYLQLVQRKAAESFLELETRAEPETEDADANGDSSTS